MGERSAPQDSQIDTQLRLEQAQAFSDIFQRTLQASGREQYAGTLSAVITLKGAEIRFESPVDRDREEVKVPSFTITTLENGHADRGRNKGRIAVFKSSQDGIVRDLSVYDDTHSMMPGMSEAFSDLRPDLKDQLVDLEMGTRLLELMRAPMLSEGLVAELVTAVSKKDEKVLNDEAKRLAKINERAKNSTKRAYLVQELVRTGVIPFIPGPLEPQDDIDQLLKDRYGFEGKTLLDSL